MAAGQYPGAPAGSARVTRGGLLATAFMFVCAIYFLLPAWWLVVSSTKGPSTLYSSEGFWFSQLHFASNLTGLFTYDGGIYWHWLINTVFYAGAGALCATLLAAGAGYALATPTGRCSCPASSARCRSPRTGRASPSARASPTARAPRPTGPPPPTWRGGLEPGLHKLGPGRAAADRPDLR